MRRYLTANMLGLYEIKFLPFAGGIDEQPHVWLSEIEIIIDALNSK